MKGRAVVDAGGKRIVLADVSGNVAPDALPTTMSPDKVRHYSFEGDTLSLETRDGARVLARTVWKKAQ
jgi:phosphosulfolactate phosphohydrolase-like enzyme